MPKSNEELDEPKYDIGSLLIYKDLNSEQKELFIKLLSDDSSYLFQILFNVIENDYKVLQLIDLFAGQKIQFPDRKKVHRLLEKIKIYTFVKHSNNKDNACKLLAKQYNKRILQIRTIVDRIDYLLANGDYRDIEKLKESAKED